MTNAQTSIKRTHIREWQDKEKSVLNRPGYSPGWLALTVPEGTEKVARGERNV